MSQDKDVVVYNENVSQLNDLEKARALVLKECAEKLSILEERELPLLESRDVSISAILDSMKFEDLCNLDSAKFFYGLAITNQNTRKAFGTKFSLLSKEEPYLSPASWGFNHNLDVCSPIINLKDNYDESKATATFLLAVRLLVVGSAIGSTSGVRASIYLNRFYENSLENRFYNLFYMEDEGAWELIVSDYGAKKEITGTYDEPLDAFKAFMTTFHP